MTPQDATKHANPTFGLVGIFALLLFVTGALFYSYGRDVEFEVQDRIVRQELERSKSQTREFAKKVKDALKRSKFSSVVSSNKQNILDFRELADSLLQQNRYVAYVHLQNENGETLMFKGPEVIQKVVFKDKSVTFMERSTESMRYLKLDDGGVEEGITDIATPIRSDEGDGKSLGQLRVGVSHNKLAAYTSRATSRQKGKLTRYLVLATLLFLAAFATVRYHYWRIQRLEESLTYQSRLAYVGSLASGLVHELRNPINSINLNLSLLEEEVEDIGNDGSSLKRLLKRIKPGLGHLEKVSNEFLEFARPPDVKLEDLSIEQEISSVVELVAAQCREAQVQCTTEIAQELGYIKLDRTRLRQILLNLMVNGIQAMPTGGVLSLKARRDSEWLTVSISDTGMGMTQDAQKNLFKLFYTTKEGGVGLGLPIVKRLVLDLSGQIDVISEKEKGTTFEVKFPNEPMGEISLEKGTANA